MNKKIFPVFLIVMVDIFGLMLIFPILPLYAEKMGASPLMASLLVSAYAVCQFISSPLLGRLSDRIGRKPVLMISQVGTLFGFILLAVADSLPLIFLSRIIDGVTAGNVSVAHAYVSDVSESRNRARTFGIMGVATAMGFVVGPGLAGILASANPRFPIYGAILASMTSIMATVFLLPGRSPSVSRDDDSALSSAGWLDVKIFKRLSQQPALFLLLGQFALFSLAFSGFFSGFSLFAERHYSIQGEPFSVRQIGFVFTILGLSSIPIQILVLPFGLKKFGERSLISMGFVGIGIGFFLLAFESLWILTLAIVFLGTMSSMLRPSLISLITQQVGRHEQGMILGTTQSILSVCQTVSPIVGGWLIGHGFLKPWAFYSAGLALLGWVVGTKVRLTVSNQ